MKGSILCLVVSLSVSAVAAEKSGLDDLQGKWSVTKTNGEGDRYTQHLDIKDSRLAFELRDGSGEVRFYAKGKIKAEKAGPLNVLIVSDIEAGRSSSELEAVNGDRTSVFAMREGKLVLVSNMDKERDNQPPTLDTYSREGGGRAATRPAPDMEKLLGKWDMELMVQDNTIDYELEFEKANDGLQATLISPRSGKHKFKKVELKDGQLEMEIDREIEGRETTLVYKGKLSGAGLSGTVTANGLDIAATWKATR